MELNVEIVCNALNGTYSGMIPFKYWFPCTRPTESNNIPLGPFKFNSRQTEYSGEILPLFAFTAATTTQWEVQMTEEFKPKTEFVKKLLELRKRAIRNGMKLLTVDEVLAEKHALRDETN